ncbi:hypothetical protein QR680_014325 [Steinernema hermaphroditum]|uniref:Uncharacterized protein n=1 Tax=Steinernema hermaphroditum TaxID=289476 RepID=A0AA39I8I3_9BILA|nr:hypothetical protein QR680_014325 [Steinernema hermaphroditum]
MMKQLLVVLLFSAVVFAEFSRKYRGDNVDVTAKVKIEFVTSQCFQSGTDGDITPHLGFINEKNILLWDMPVKGIYGWDGSNFENSETTVAKDTVSGDIIALIERACYKYANESMDLYEKCFTPNIINIEKYGWHQISSAWKPLQINAEVEYVMGKEDLAVKKTTFGPFADCDSNWVDTYHKESYIRSDAKDSIKREYFPSEYFKVTISMFSFFITLISATLRPSDRYAPVTPPFILPPWLAGRNGYVIEARDVGPRFNRAAALDIGLRLRELGDEFERYMNDAIQEEQERIHNNSFWSSMMHLFV